MLLLCVLLLCQRGAIGNFNPAHDSSRSMTWKHTKTRERSGLSNLTFGSNRVKDWDVSLSSGAPKRLPDFQESTPDYDRELVARCVETGAAAGLRSRLITNVRRHDTQPYPMDAGLRMSSNPIRRRSSMRTLSATALTVAAPSSSGPK